MPFTIVRQDITKMEVDAIVNAANTDLIMGGGVCGAIFKAAGANKMQKACDSVAPIKTGGAAITPGFALPAKYVIHAAGPIYSQWSKEQCAVLLRSAYIESLKLAAKHGCSSIAFPLISSGIYGYPKEEALREATTAITGFLADNDMDVYLAVFDKRSFVISEQLMGNVASYIDQHYVDIHEILRKSFNAPEPSSYAMDGSVGRFQRHEYAQPHWNQQEAIPNIKDLNALMDNLDEPFSDTLFHLIDAKGKTDVEVYKKANIDRKLFSKIRSVKGYTPRKPTILALAISLELTLKETNDLLKRAGYALSHTNKFDVIVEYFIINGRYNIFDINEVLFQYDQPLLGG